MVSVLHKCIYMVLIFETVIDNYFKKISFQLEVESMDSSRDKHVVFIFNVSISYVLLPIYCFSRFEKNFVAGHARAISNLTLSSLSCKHVL